MLKDFKPEIKLFVIVALIAVVISVGGILLLRGSVVPIPEQTVFEKSEERDSEETTLPKSLLAVSVESKASADFYIEGVESLGSAMPFRAYRVLVVADTQTGERKKIELKDLVDEQTFSYLKDLEEDRTPPSLYVEVDENSFALEGKTVWGRVDLFTSGDPPFPFIGNYFKIDAVNWEIETFEAPIYAANAAIHPGRESVLYDSTQSEGLFLYLRDLRTGKETVLASYPLEVLQKYVRYGGLGYRHSWFAQQESRQLQPEWIDEDTISYLDFVTREKVVVVDLNILGWQTYRNNEFGFEVKYPEELSESRELSKHGITNFRNDTVSIFLDVLNNDQLFNLHDYIAIEYSKNAPLIYQDLTANNEWVKWANEKIGTIDTWSYGLVPNREGFESTTFLQDVQRPNLVIIANFSTDSKEKQLAENDYMAYRKILSTFRFVE